MNDDFSVVKPLALSSHDEIENQRAIEPLLNELREMAGDRFFILDGDYLDLLGLELFRAYLWHISKHEMLPIRRAKVNAGVSSAAESYWRVSDVRKCVFDLSKIKRFCACEQMTESQFLRELIGYLSQEKSYGVFTEYTIFTEMWGATRVRSNTAGRIFLDVIFSYGRSRFGGDGNESV